MFEYKWYKTHCCYCGKQIKVKIKKSVYNDNPDVLCGNACCECVPLNSPSRNGCDESAWDTVDLEVSPRP